MTKNYTKEIVGLHDEINERQGKLYRLLEKVQQERDALDMENDRLRRSIKTMSNELEKSRTKVADLEKEKRKYVGLLSIKERPYYSESQRILDSFFPKAEDNIGLRELNKKIATLQKKLKDDSVELSAVASKIQNRAKTHGLQEASRMFDMACLMFDDVAGWQKNKKALEDFFIELNKKYGVVENTFNAPVGMVIEKTN